MITPGFSFKYNGVVFEELQKTITETEKGKLYTLEYGLQIEYLIERFPKYNVTKWTNYWYNNTDHDTGYGAVFLLESNTEDSNYEHESQDNLNERDKVMLPS